jgi:hypothetical protein
LADPLGEGVQSPLNLNPSLQNINGLEGTLLAQVNTLPSGSVPAAALSRYYKDFEPSLLGINVGNGGKTRVPAGYPNNANDPFYWYVVVDLRDLTISANVTSRSANSVPSQITGFQNNPNYFLFFIANAQISPNYPQGALYAFLESLGADTELPRGEEIFQQLGTGALRNFSYVLASTFDPSDPPGFEVFSTVHYATLAMYFLPVTINGKTTYTPVLLNSQTA